MAEEHRRVVATTSTNARALSDNLVNQGYRVDVVAPTHWILRKVRRRGDIVVTVAITQPDRWPAAASPAWGPPTGPPAR